MQYYQEKSETYAIISKSFFPTANFFSFKKIYAVYATSGSKKNGTP
jgi:hypothetical protein